VSGGSVAMATPKTTMKMTSSGYRNEPYAKGKYSIPLSTFRFV